MKKKPVKKKPVKKKPMKKKPVKKKTLHGRYAQRIRNYIRPIDLLKTE